MRGLFFVLLFVTLVYAIYTPSGRRAKPCEEIRDALEERYRALMSQHGPANTLYDIGYYWARWGAYKARCDYWRRAVSAWNTSTWTVYSDFVSEK